MTIRRRFVLGTARVKALGWLEKKKEGKNQWKKNKRKKVNLSAQHYKLWKTHTQKCQDRRNSVFIRNIVFIRTILFSRTIMFSRNSVVYQKLCYVKPQSKAWEKNSFLFTLQSACEAMHVWCTRLQPIEILYLKESGVVLVELCWDSLVHTDSTLSPAWLLAWGKYTCSMQIDRMNEWVRKTIFRFYPVHLSCFLSFTVLVPLPHHCKNRLHVLKGDKCINVSVALSVFSILVCTL